MRILLVQGLSAGVSKDDDTTRTRARSPPRWARATKEQTQQRLHQLFAAVWLGSFCAECGSIDGCRYGYFLINE